MPNNEANRQAKANVPEPPTPKGHDPAHIKKVVEKRDVAIQEETLRNDSADFHLQKQHNNTNNNNKKSLQNSNQQRKDFSQVTQTEVAAKPKVEEVKKILTHCINGYIIEESSHPFPVNGDQISPSDIPLKENGKIVNDNSMINRTPSAYTDSHVVQVKTTVDACGNCGNSGPKARLKIRKGARPICSNCIHGSKNNQSLEMWNPVTSNLNDLSGNFSNEAKAAGSPAGKQPEENDGHEPIRKKAKLVAKKPIDHLNTVSGSKHIFQSF